MGLTDFRVVLLAIALGGMGMMPLNAAPPVSTAPSAVSGPQSTTQPTEDQIRAAMKAISQAEAQENVEALVGWLAPFVVSTVTVDLGDKQVTRTFEGVSAHRRALQESYQEIKTKEVLDEKMTVRFDEDGNIAVVTRYTIETADLNDGRNVISMGKDIIRFALIDGQPKVISVVSDGWSENRP